MIDLHAHILPGIDDGPPDMEESLALCRMALDDGIDTIVATPHMLHDLYPDVTEERIAARVEEINERLTAEGIALSVRPGAEFHINVDLPERFAQQKPLTLDSVGKYILLELPEDVLPQGLDKFLFSLRLIGYTIVLSHPERNYEIQSDLTNLERLVGAGHLVQLTAASVDGGFGEETEECATRIVKKGLAHIVATDCHNRTGRPPILSKAREVVSDIAGSGEGDRLFDANPAAILAGEEVEKEPRKKRAVKWYRRFLS